MPERPFFSSTPRRIRTCNLRFRRSVKAESDRVRDMNRKAEGSKAYEVSSESSRLAGTSEFYIVSHRLPAILYQILYQ
jgi:hypothetical protein